jgi:hypothetical protein
MHQPGEKPRPTQLLTDERLNVSRVGLQSTLNQALGGQLPTHDGMADTFAQKGISEGGGVANQESATSLPGPAPLVERDGMSLDIKFTCIQSPPRQDFTEQLPQRSSFRLAGKKAG